MREGVVGVGAFQRIVAKHAMVLGACGFHQIGLGGLAHPFQGVEVACNEPAIAADDSYHPVARRVGLENRVVEEFNREDLGQHIACAAMRRHGHIHHGHQLLRDLAPYKVRRQ